MMGMVPLLRPNTGMNTKDCSLKYTPNTLTAVGVKAMRILFMPKFVTEPMACMTMLGRPTR